jgi:hypothetical protein
MSCFGNNPMRAACATRGLHSACYTASLRNRLSEQEIESFNSMSTFFTRFRTFGTRGMPRNRWHRCRSMMGDTDSPLPYFFNLKIAAHLRKASPNLAPLSHAALTSLSHHAHDVSSPPVLALTPSIQVHERHVLQLSIRDAPAKLLLPLH